MLHTVTGIVDPSALKGDETTATPYPPTTTTTTRTTHPPSERKQMWQTSSVKIRLMMLYAAVQNSWAAGDRGVENV